MSSVLAKQIVSSMELRGCHALLRSDMYEQMILNCSAEEISKLTFSKQHLPVRIWVKFSGPLKLIHYCTEKRARKILNYSFEEKDKSPANFDPSIKGVYCVRADCPHGLRAGSIVLSDYPDYTQKITFTYEGEYYLVVNHIEEYVFITGDMNQVSVLSNTLRGSQ